MAKTDTTVTADAPFGLKPDGTPRKRAASTAPRATKPVFAIVKYTDPNTGQPMKLDRNSLHITFEKDASKLVTLVTGEGMGDAAVVKVEMPEASSEAPKAA